MSIDQRTDIETARGTKVRARRAAGPPQEASPSSAVQITHSTLVARAMDADSRRAMIEECAYYRAAQRGFAPGQEIGDWLAAEAEVDARLCGLTQSS